MLTVLMPHVVGHVIIGGDSNVKQKINCACDK